MSCNFVSHKLFECDLLKTNNVDLILHVVENI